jgi:hypothetical protein
MAQYIRSGADAKLPPGNLETVIAAANFNAQPALQLFDVVIKWPAQA